ncbi:MAG: LacI family DNA-binding transcriptional regulator [Planctomycetes bacterium]|nr:LacI family DNA-binding transcriptional regulator [Planctomycetota bacterium]
MSITQKELAQVLGVSQVSVSRALRGSDGVGDKLRERILDEARKRGYSIRASNHEARAMRKRALGEKQTTDVVCLMVPIDDESGQDSFHARIFSGLSEEARKLGMETVLAGEYSAEFPLLVLRGQVDGAVCLLGDIEVSRVERTCPVPLVSIFSDLPGADLVTVDNVEGSRQIGEYLVSQGHERAAFFGPTWELAQQRLAGLRMASGLEVPEELVFTRRFMSAGHQFEEVLQKAFGNNLVENKEKLPFTAVVAYNDFMAAVMMHKLRAAGWDIPGELSITGFDGVWPTKATDPQLTTCAIPLEEVGAEAMRALAQRLKNPDRGERRVVLSPEFIPGETSSTPLQTSENLVKSQPR